jgi:hypothetical protein
MKMIQKWEGKFVIPIPEIKIIGSSGVTVSKLTGPSDSLDSISGTSQYYLGKNIKKTD